jgi:hypothetical protein
MLIIPNQLYLSIILVFFPCFSVQLGYNTFRSSGWPPIRSIPFIDQNLDLVSILRESVRMLPLKRDILIGQGEIRTLLELKGSNYVLQTVKWEMSVENYSCAYSIDVGNSIG